MLNQDFYGKQEYPSFLQVRDHFNFKGNRDSEKALWKRTENYRSSSISLSSPVAQFQFQFIVLP